jgi:prepilin-type processing-associated H-X9-DG protein
MTILLSENMHKNYDDPSIPFTWLAGTEQQLGIVWVVPPGSNTSPTSGTGIDQQEPINVVPATAQIPGDFAPGIPRFARPSSNHGEGAVVAYCDGHVEFLRDDIDYTVYQRLLTSNGRKCVDPRDHTSTETDKFRVLPPLSEKDYQ